MTKADILKRIEEQKTAQCEGVRSLSKILAMPAVGTDATVIASILNIINGTIFDTMTTLALILCEMMPEEATEKDPEPKMGDHTDACNADCQCMTCVNDNSHDIKDLPCCDKHGFRGCVVHNCPDYVKEG